MKYRSSYHIKVAGISLMLIFTIFALTIFAILSLRASYHELKLSEKTRDYVEDYYKADSDAEDILMLISETVEEHRSNLNISMLSKKLSTIDNLTIDENTHILTYLVPMNYNNNLKVTLKLPMNAREGVKVHSWEMISTEQRHLR